MKKLVMVVIVIFLLVSSVFAFEGATDNSPDWFFPEWVSKAPNSCPIRVKDTDSPLGRYSLKTKEIGLKDLARIHGHLCDGLIAAFLGISHALKHLFPDGIVDRTDLRVVTKNSPCFVDVVSFITGARINFMTLRIDNSLGWEWIVQRISTGETYHVKLRPGVFPETLQKMEEYIRSQREKGLTVSAEVIDRYEEEMWKFNHKLLYTPVEKLFVIEKIPNYKFHFLDLFIQRGDIINKDMPRK